MIIDMNEKFTAGIGDAISIEFFSDTEFPTQIEAIILRIVDDEKFLENGDLVVIRTVDSPMSVREVTLYDFRKKADGRWYYKDTTCPVVIHPCEKKVEF